MVASADVWSLAAQQAKAAPKQAGERPDAALWVVGARGAGAPGAARGRAGARGRGRRGLWEKNDEACGDGVCAPSLRAEGRVRARGAGRGSARTFGRRLRPRWRARGVRAAWAAGSRSRALCEARARRSGTLAVQDADARRLTLACEPPRGAHPLSSRARTCIPEGKSTLVQRFLNADKSDAPKPTAHVEYTFGRRAAQGGADRKDVAHLWEVSGADELQAEFARADHAFLPLPTLATAVVVIALDLSQPNDCLPTLERWLRRLRERLDAAYERLRRRGSKLPDQLLSRARKLFGSAHEDRDAVQHFGVPVVVVANKYDAFQGQDVEMKKVLVRALRYFCHTHGASLIFTGGLERPVQGAMRTQLQHYRTLLNHLVFHSAPLRVAEGDHNKPITVPAGADKLKAIGRPKGGGEGTAGWRQLVHQYFPPPEGAAKETRYAIDAAKYAEEDIDLLRQHKDAELASVLRQQQASAKAKAAKRRTARQ